MDSHIRTLVQDLHDHICKRLAQQAEEIKLMREETPNSLSTALIARTELVQELSSAFRNDLKHILEADSGNS